MCTSIEQSVPMTGSAKGATGWFTMTEAVVSYDHPTHAMLEQSVKIDFVNLGLPPGARAAVEMTKESAWALAAAIVAVLRDADAQDAYEAPAR